LGVRQTRFIGVWVAIELNILRFIGIIVLTKECLESAGLKYFIIQRLGSGALLGGLVVRGRGLLMSWGASIVGVALVLKLGIAPLHQ
jgi:NADH:ubiquinone oxidoreductase subunit 2 (subunit N)